MTRDEAFVEQEPGRSVVLGTGGADLASSPRFRSECAPDINYLQSPHRDVPRVALWNAELWKTYVLPMYLITTPSYLRGFSSCAAAVTEKTQPLGKSSVHMVVGCFTFFAR